jgi:SP family general alpha glucoside:H+ symporter-like MFS transporter
MADVENKTIHAQEHEQRNDSIYAEKAEMSDFKASAIEAENAEHNMTVLQAVRAYPMASFWAFVVSISCHCQRDTCAVHSTDYCCKKMSCTIIMESYDVFLMGNFLALPAFTKDYGIWNEVKQEFVVAPAWQSAIQG